MLVMQKPYFFLHTTITCSVLHTGGGGGGGGFWDRQTWLWRWRERSSWRGWRVGRRRSMSPFEWGRWAVRRLRAPTSPTGNAPTTIRWSARMRCRSARCSLLPTPSVCVLFLLWQAPRECVGFVICEVLCSCRSKGRSPRRIKIWTWCSERESLSAC